MLTMPSSLVHCCATIPAHKPHREHKLPSPHRQSLTIPHLHLQVRAWLQLLWRLQHRSCLLQACSVLPVLLRVLSQGLDEGCEDVAALVVTEALKNLLKHADDAQRVNLSIYK